MVSKPRFFRIFSSVILIFSCSVTTTALPIEIGTLPVAQQVLASQADGDILTYNASGNAEHEASTLSPRPFYAIAHRVLTARGARDALNNGANALEMDMTAWRNDWYADHDGTLTSYGDLASTMFETVVDERKAGKTVNFVWLDIKNPDYCDPYSAKWRHCSIDRLRDLARKHLEPHGVQVLYGFYGGTLGKAYHIARNGLNSNEAININGKAGKVLQEFEANPPLEMTKRVMSYGYFNLPYQFGSCEEANGYYTCVELKKAVESYGFGKVFGWTVAKNHAWYVDRLLGAAGIDGAIYGFKQTYYYDHANVRDAIETLYS